ncbi:MAG: hypothetical protein IT552_02440 [Sphingomonadaceae bacterium]|nr:hypothetical protein [Sphingomonadaceae bacterium]
MSKELAKKIFDTNIRIAGIWPIFGCSDGPSDVFTDAIEYTELPPEIASLIPNYDDDFDHDSIDWEELWCDAFNKGMHGYLLLADCPVFTKINDTSVSFSWGHWRTKLFYGENVEALIAQACAWGEAQYSAAKAGAA